MDLTIMVNGSPRQVSSEPDRSLLDVLRDDLGLTGTKFGCGEGACGACTVLLGRRAVTACTTPVRDAAGQRVTTVEGLAEDGVLHPVQQAWLETGAMQCGYCTPGWLTATAALLGQVPHPDDERIAAVLAGNVCRCCTYPRIRRAVHRAAELMERPEDLLPVPPDAAMADPAPDDRAAAGAAPADRAAAGTAQAAAGAAPWDRGGQDADSFFAALPGGLVAVAGSGPAGGQHDRGWDSPDDAWVHVGPDGTVTAFTGKVEAGQGTRTALALLVAEELAVPVSSVRVVMGNTHQSPFDLGTFGSRSMPYAVPPLRAAAAGARDLLVAAAAERFGLPPGDLTSGGGMVGGPDGAPSIGYGELVAGWRRVERVPSGQPVTPAAAWRTAGHPARALGAAAVVTGAKRFPADIRLDGMLAGCVLRPPAFGAVLRSVSTTDAEALPGVQIVRDDDFIGAVAPDSESARRAIEAVEASWETSPQPSRGDLGSYLRAHPAGGGEGIHAPFGHEQGDIDTALRRGHVRLEAHYSTAYIAHVPLEPRSAVARWDDGRLTVWSGTSTPFRARRELADSLGLAEDAVQVIVPDYGGGFGGKHGSAVAVEAARLARAAGRPVRIQWSRQEEFHWAYLRPAALIDIASSMNAAGEITGWSFTNVNSGSVGILSPYRIPHQRIVYQPAASPLPQGSYRALAATANHFARESHMDELAAAAGAEPLDFRLRHLDDPRLSEALRTAADRLGWSPGRRPDDSEPGTGVGIACGIEKGGRVATAARVRVAADGALHILTLVTAFDCGAIVNPDNLTNQIEGATMMGLGGALFEEIDFADGKILNASMSQYRVPRLADLPVIEVVLVDHPDQPSAGGGETPIVAIAPAIANAIFHARGRRLRTMPLAPHGVIAATAGVAARQSLKGVDVRQAVIHCRGRTSRCPAPAGLASPPHATEEVGDARICRRPARRTRQRGRPAW